jgi:hypothetical protein
MIAWWESLTTLERIFAYAAVPSSILLLVQTLLLMVGVMGGHGSDIYLESDTSGLSDMGGGADHDMPDIGAHDVQIDHGIHDTGLQILTMRGLTAFFSVGGWTGLVLLRGQVDRVASGIIAILAGLAAMVVLALLLKMALRLQSDGSMDIRNAVGACGTVYITVPANRRAKGKVMIKLQDQLRELEAVSEGGRDLKAGSLIQVVSVLNGDTLVVSEAARSTGYAQATDQN